MEKILTIVIPTYNMQDYLRRCLDSLIVPEEQMKHLEVLVVNDGSKDNSSAIAHEYQDKYPDTFRVIDKENGNYGSCVNRGLKEATGKYIKILDADDWFDTSGLVNLTRELFSINVDVVVTDFVFVNGNMNKIRNWKLLCPAYTRMSLKELLHYSPVGIVMHAICYRTNLLKEISYVQPEGISYTDQIWINEPLAKAKDIIYFPILVYKYLIGRERQTVDPKISLKNIKHHIDCALVMVKSIDSVQRNTVSWDFLTYRAVHTIKNIYIMFLNMENPDIELMDAFDKKIELLNKELYDSLDHVVLHPLIKLHYIKNWRIDHSYKFGWCEKLMLKCSSILYKFICRKKR